MAGSRSSEHGGPGVGAWDQEGGNRRWARAGGQAQIIQGGVSLSFLMTAPSLKF